MIITIQEAYWQQQEEKGKTSPPLPEWQRHARYGRFSPYAVQLVVRSSSYYSTDELADIFNCGRNTIIKFVKDHHDGK